MFTGCSLTRSQARVGELLSKLLLKYGINVHVLAARCTPHPPAVLFGFQKQTPRKHLPDLPSARGRHGEGV